MKSQSKIQETLERGLYFYGLGETDQALKLWHEVLAIDPANKAATEYIEIELGRPLSQPAPENSFDAPGSAADAGPESAGESEPAVMELESILMDRLDEEAPRPVSDAFYRGQTLMLSSRWTDAEEAFVSGHQQDSGNPIHWAHVELVRSRVIKEAIERMDGANRVPFLKMGLKELAEKNFNQEEGFILSLINGEISFQDVISLSPIPRYKTYRFILRLLDEGLIAAKKA